MKCGDGAALPVFSFREEAEMYARIEAGDGWRVREAMSEELLLALFGMPGSARRVCLDPLPSAVRYGEPASLSRERFTRLLDGGRWAWRIGQREEEARKGKSRNSGDSGLAE